MPSAALVLAELYEHINHKGASWLLVGYDGSCDSSGYAVPDIGWLWSNVASSARTQYECSRLEAYDLPSYRGASRAWQRPGSWLITVPDMGDFNDKLTSFRVKRV